MRFKLGIGSKSKNILATSIENQKNSDGQNAGKELDPKIKARIFESKEETFFDSQACLDSDCEDDYFSVNGDFTPSRGSTPNRQISSNKVPQLNKYFSPATLPDVDHESSPTDGKKKLFDLLQENESEESSCKDVSYSKYDSNTEPRINKVEAIKDPRLLNGTPGLNDTNSACHSDDIPTKDPKGYKERISKTKQCCLPSLMHNLSFKEKRKQKLSHNH